MMMNELILSSCVCVVQLASCVVIDDDHNCVVVVVIVVTMHRERSMCICFPIKTW